MEAAPQRTTLWSTTQAYIIAVCCLLLGAAVGYLLRSPGPSVAAKPAAATAPETAPPSAAQQPTPEQMKHMAEKQVEPLLAKLKTTPNDPELLTQIAASYYAAHQFGLAASYYERLAAAKPTAKSLTSLGNAYYYAQDPEKALATFQRAVALEPGFPDALFNIGMIKWQAQGDPKGAVEAWQKLLKANPNHPRRQQVEEMIARAKQHIAQVPTAASAKP